LLPVLGLLCLQSALFLAFAVQFIDIRAFLSFHLAVCASTWTFGHWLWVGASPAADTQSKTATLVQLVAWTALAGPFGTAVAGALLAPRNAEAGHSQVVAGGAAATGGKGLSRLDLLHGSLLDKRLRLRSAHAIRPLVDIIIEGTQTEKFSALSLMSKRYDPVFAAALRQALGDKDASVRVLAATVMAQQNNTYTKRIGALQAIARSESENSAHWCELGQVHFNYALSGLLEASRAGIEVNHALQRLARAVELDPDNAAAVSRLEAVRRFSACHTRQGIAAHAAGKRDNHQVASDGA
jgi:hypothetical protein